MNSYQIEFARPLPGETIEEALARAAGEPEPDELNPELLTQWERLVPRVQEILGDVAVMQTDDERVLGHEETGLRLRLAPSGVSLSMPYEHEGNTVERMHKLRVVALVVEEETRLDAWDPQLEEAVADAPYDVDGTLAAADIVNRAGAVDPPEQTADAEQPKHHWRFRRHSRDAPPPTD